MTAYIVTIRRDEPRSADTGQTVVRFDLTSGQPRIRELVVTAGTPGGLAPTDLPTIDLELLVRALSGTADNAARGIGRRATPPEGETKRATGGRRARKAAAAKSTGTPRRRGRAGASAASTAGRTGERTVRSYRRMPDPEEVLGVYRSAGTISALAQHYGVPRHTAQGWAGRLRRQGYEIGRS